MTDMDEKDRWIGVSEAMEIYIRRLGFPEALEKEFVEYPRDCQPGMMWLVDRTNAQDVDGLVALMTEDHRRRRR